MKFMPNSTLGLAFLITVVSMNFLLFTGIVPNSEVLAILTNVISFFAGKGASTPTETVQQIPTTPAKPQTTKNTPIC